MTGTKDDALEEHPYFSELVYDQGFLRVFKDQVKTPKGDITSREYIDHPGAVTILAWKDDGRLVLIHQFRYAVRRICLEIPAGRIDTGESHDMAAKRELREEVGYEAKHWRYIGPILPCIGYSNEVIHVYEARHLYFVGTDFDQHEMLKTIEMHTSEIKRAIREGTLTDAKTLAALSLVIC